VSGLGNGQFCFELIKRTAQQHTDPNSSSTCAK
jgi:hypothetical protein